ncbi:Sac domain-containing inositol phosphatase 2 [Cladobotryum mycophilum]|uniref:Sac domain-containing inositol phosphatase 2 n=1 Tax=Cladobotryum mycophilum TaxID=491253 RepID=A0ABR0S5X6_9HYPO
MPGIARKVLIFAAVDGLLVQPLSSKGQKPFQPVRIKYGTGLISPATRDQVPSSTETDSWFEALGVIGLITVSRLTYLITITRREQVAQIFGHPIYVVTQVAVTPCSSKGDAEESIQKTVVQLRTQAPHSSSEDVESSDEEAEVPEVIIDEVDDAVAKDANALSELARSSVAEDVIRKKGTYGRFAQRWFSKSGWAVDQRRTLGLSNSPTTTSPPTTEPTTPSLGGEDTPTGDENDAPQIPVSTLLPKLLRTIQVLLGSSRSFYFSYDVDITRSMASKASAPHADTPLYAQVDSIFFWNRHILQPFLEAGHEPLALPLMQGFIGQKTFVVDSQPPQVDDPSAESVELSDLSPPLSPSTTPPPGATREIDHLRPSEKRYQITLISRRSTKRAGLRYLRRGIDEDGFAANSVETEQILSSPTWDGLPIYSFLQIRGSIPLFFTQSAYSLKPVPVLQHSEEANYKASKTHFERLSRNYGELQVVNLVEKHGVEEPIGSQYQKTVERLNSELRDEAKISFEWFDFHHVCRGMKFENVSVLLSLLKDQIESLGSTVQKEGTIVEKQKGVFRTNCMDCLDRTNVCQSSFAKHMLDWQLRQEGIDMTAQLDQETAWFNILWADNGDAVSKQYASTAAMKGDYTRTRKRDYRGALNDLGLSVARLYSGMVNDYFSQAAIDFLLGNVTAKVFDEFEADMMTKDPAVSIGKMRERAIELCQKRVVADASEDIHGGWVLISPHTADVVKSWSMEDVVLLLTDAAVYLCRFNWDLDKVSSFERVSLASITNIKLGTYITSTVSPSHMDEARNVGFVVTYQPGKSDIRRTNTRTLSTRGDIAPSSAPNSDDGRSTGLVGILSGKPKQPTIRKLAFKAPYIDSSRPVIGAGPQQTEMEQVITICSEIERLAFERQLLKQGEEKKSLIEKDDIISLDVAKKSTGLLEQLGHSLKKLVWA